MKTSQPVQLKPVLTLIGIALVLGLASSQPLEQVPADLPTAPASMNLSQVSLSQSENPIAVSFSTPLLQAGAGEITASSRSAAAAPALTFPDPTLFQWKQITSGLSRPIGLFNAKDGSGRLFVLEQSGRIRIIQNGQVLPTPFLDIHTNVRSNGGEQGLLGLAFSPDYIHNGEFFVNFTQLTHGDTVIARFNVTSNPNVADPKSRKILIYQAQPFTNHNGGELAFGPDGYLYLGLGDGGGAGDPHNNGQSLKTLLGKILRIDVNSPTGYTIPPTNPFTGARQKHAIWAYGLRNPWRFSFDSQTGDLYIGDVGQDHYEEIDFQAAGSTGGTNYGWRYREGLHAYRGKPPKSLVMTNPVAEYSHSLGCAVIGGNVYRGSALPEFNGIYLFGDYCSGNIWGLARDSGGVWQMQLLFHYAGSISSFGLDENGELYLVDNSHGLVLQLVRK